MQDCREVVHTHIGEIEVPVILAGLVGHVRVFRTELCSSIVTHVYCVAVVDEIERQWVPDKVAIHPRLGVLAHPRHEDYIVHYGTHFHVK